MPVLEPDAASRPRRRGAGLALACLPALAGGCAGDDAPPGTCVPGGPTTTVQLHIDTVTQVFGAPRANATWIAVQDGTCPWQPIEGVGGEYTFEVTTARYGVAIVCDDPGAPTPTTGVLVELRTTAESTDVRAACGRRLADDTPAHRLGMRLTDTGGDGIRMHLRDHVSDWYVVGGALVDVTVGALAGTFDLVIARDGGGTGEPEQLRFHRDRIADRDHVLPIDPADPAWVALGAPVVLRGADAVGDELASLTASYMTRWGTHLVLADDGFFAGEPTTLAYATVPAAARVVGDAYLLAAVASDGDAVRRSERFVVDPGEAHLAPPPALAAHTVTVDADQAVTWHLDAMPDALGYAVVQTVETPAAQRRSTVRASAGWLGDAARHDVPLPALAEVEGWQPSWTLAPATGTWAAGAFGGDGGWPAEARRATIGDDPGAPAGLAGTTRWSSETAIAAPSRP